MKKRTRMLAGLLAAVLVVGSMVGCGGGEKKESSGGEGGSTGSGQVFTYSTNSVVVGLNPIMNTTAPDNEAHNILCEPLVRKVTKENNTYDVIPAAAEKWDVSEEV